MENDFYFIEHSRPDLETRYENGVELGWDKDRILCFDKAEDYIPVYAKASCFFGNRLHGALLVASMDRPVVAVGYESRLWMVLAINGFSVYPSRVSIDHLKAMLDGPDNTNNRAGIIKDAEIRLLELLNNFIRA